MAARGADGVLPDPPAPAARAFRHASGRCHRVRSSGARRPTSSRRTASPLATAGTRARAIPPAASSGGRSARRMSRSTGRQQPDLARGAVLDIEVEPNPYQPDSWVDLEIVDGDRRLAPPACVAAHPPALRPARRRRAPRARRCGCSTRAAAVNRCRSSSRAIRCVIASPRERARGAAARIRPRRWRRVSKDNAKLLVKRTASGIEVTTDPGKYSVLHAGTVRSSRRRTGATSSCSSTCRSTGRLAFGVMDDDARMLAAGRVVRKSSSRRAAPSRSRSTCRRGTTFSLFVSNNRPEAESHAWSCAGCSDRFRWSR